MSAGMEDSRVSGQGKGRADCCLALLHCCEEPWLLVQNAAAARYVSWHAELQRMCTGSEETTAWPDAMPCCLESLECCQEPWLFDVEGSSGKGVSAGMEKERLECVDWEREGLTAAGRGTPLLGFLELFPPQHSRAGRVKRRSGLQVPHCICMAVVLQV